MRWMILIALMISLTSVEAADSEITRRVQEAEAYFQNGQYPKAAAAYQNLLELSLTPQQEALVFYNLGTALLQMGQAEQAIGKFKEVRHEPDVPALIRLRLHANEASAYLTLVADRQKNWDPTSESYVSEGEGSMQLAQEGLKAVNQALAAERELALEEGREASDNPLGLAVIRQDLRQEYARIHQALAAHRLQNTTLLEGTETLAAALEDRRNQLDLLGISQKSTEQDLQRLAIAEKARYPLWEALRSQVTKDLTEATPQMNLLLQAEQNYYAGVEYLAEGSLWNGRRQIAQALLLMRTLREMEKEQDPVDHVLQERIVLRERILTSAGIDELEGALIEEEKAYSALTQSMLDGLATQLDKEDAEQGDSKERELAAELLNSLAKSIASEIEKGNTATSIAWQDLSKYRQIPVPEGEGMAKVRVALEEVMRNGELNQLPTLFYDWKAIDHKLRVRQKVADGATNEKIQLTRKELLAINELEEAALQGEEKALQDLLIAITRALYAWDLESLITSELHSLASAYVKALKAKDYDSNEVDYLQERIQTLEEWVGSSPLRDRRAEDYEKLEQGLKEVERYSSQSQQVKEIGSEPLAKLFLAAAKNSTVRALRHWQGAPESPASILETGILEQTHALQYNQAAQDLQLSQGLTHAWEELLRDGQSDVIESVENFANAALSALSQGGQEPADPTVLWETEPWNEVMALFEAGLLAASDAKELLEQDPAQTGTAATKQREAIAYWKEALELLKSDSEGEQGQDDSEQEEESSDSQESPPDEGDSEGGDSPEQEEQEQATEDETESTGDLLEMLQTMYQDDQIQDKKKIPPKQGLRPW